MIPMNRYITVLTLIASLCLGTACTASEALTECDGSCIYSAIRHDEVHKIREVLYDRASFNRLIPVHNTDPLLYSARAEACAVASYFLETFYRSDQAREARNEAYLQAAGTGAECIVRDLLRAGIDINYRSITGANALYHALDSERINIAKLLLDNGINVFAETDTNRNMLFAAAASGDVAIAERLVDMGVRPNVKDFEGKSPADYAAFKWGGNSAMYEFLIQAEREQKLKDKSPQ